MIDTPVCDPSLADCEDLFGSLPAVDVPGAWDDSAIRRHLQAQDRARWFFATSLGREVLASLTWRSFDDREDSSVRPAGPVLWLAGSSAQQPTFIMPLRRPRRGEDGELFLLVRGWRVKRHDGVSPAEGPWEWDDSRVEWAVIGRDPAKPRACCSAVLHEARTAVEQQMRENPHWRWAGA